MTEEWVAALVLAVLPALVILASLLTVKMFVDRYVLWSAIGMGICLAVLLHEVLRGSQIAAVILLAPLLLWSVRTISTETASSLRNSGSLQQQILTVHTDRTPIVIPQVHQFMELWFYSSEETRPKLIYLVNPDLEFHYRKEDSTSLILAALRRYVPVGVQDYEAFVRAHPHFIVAGDGEGDWIVQHLRASNFRFVPIEGFDRLFEVHAP